ncbi:MAG: dTDP-4-dehydrorhamnose reductase, partial [Sediminibacterium sp.]|nr:dTDP-4-dehydrorhamnose reductase [Sediminibacterium sp.]
MEQKAKRVLIYPLQLNMQPRPIIVTGISGQLGQELRDIFSDSFLGYPVIYVGREQIDLSNPATIAPFFEQHQPLYCIHAAAYTAVDRAEQEKELAATVNATSAGEIARCCNSIGCRLVYISTDYVFNGRGSSPYTTDEPCEPVNYYGLTKWKGEQLILAALPSATIIRTSWVFSAYGNNFVKTMLRLMKEREVIRVVNDQRGCPTYAADLAAAIANMLQRWEKGNTHSGIYHFSNAGDITWYDFASAIRDMAGLTCKVEPIPSADFPTPASRPGYSVMD